MDSGSDKLNGNNPSSIPVVKDKIYKVKRRPRPNLTSLVQSSIKCKVERHERYPSQSGCIFSNLVSFNRIGVCVPNSKVLFMRDHL